jgi:hypothetical protein
MTKFESVLAQALELDEDDRQLLAIRLNLSVERQPGYDEAWAEEIKRRIERLDRGEADEVDWQDAESFIFDD